MLNIFQDRVVLFEVEPTTCLPFHLSASKEASTGLAEVRVGVVRQPLLVVGKVTVAAGVFARESKADGLVSGSMMRLPQLICGKSDHVVLLGAAEKACKVKVFWAMLLGVVSAQFRERYAAVRAAGADGRVLVVGVLEVPCEMRLVVENGCARVVWAVKRVVSRIRGVWAAFHIRWRHCVRLGSQSSKAARWLRSGGWFRIRIWIHFYCCARRGERRTRILANRLETKDRVDNVGKATEGAIKVSKRGES